MPLRTWVGIAAAAALAGCMGYRVGTSLPGRIRSIHIPTFVNTSGEPGIEAVATGETIQEFQKDGTLRIAGPDEADAVLTVTLTSVRLEPLRFSQDRATQATEYRLLLRATAVFKDRKTGEVLGRYGSLVGKAVFDPGSDVPASKQRAVRPAARDLAHEVVEGVVELW